MATNADWCLSRARADSVATSADGCFCDCGKPYAGQACERLDATLPVGPWEALGGAVLFALLVWLLLRFQQQVRGSTEVEYSPEIINMEAFDSVLDVATFYLNLKTYGFEMSNDSSHIMRTAIACIILVGIGFFLLDLHWWGVEKQRVHRTFLVVHILIEDALQLWLYLVLSYASLDADGAWAVGAWVGVLQGLYFLVDKSGKLLKAPPPPYSSPDELH